MAATGTPATRLCAAEGVPVTLHPYRHDPRATSYGEEAALALGYPVERVFKTLVVRVEGLPPPGIRVAVVPVAGTLDLRALATASGGKRAALVEPAVAERTTGYVTGGISPLRQRSRLPTLVDNSVTDFETVLVSAGRRGLMLELSGADLLRLTGAELAPLSRR